MKRLNFNHVGIKSLFVALVMTFMGAVSVSAQNYFPNGQALTIVGTELTTLSGSGKSTQPSSLVNGGGIQAQAAEVNPSNLTPLKVSILQAIQLELKYGADTGTAIENVFSPLENGAVGDRAIKLQTVKTYVIDLLS